MSRQLDTDRLVESWLAEGPSRLPDRVIDSIVTHIERNPRRQQVNRMMLAVGGVAAAIILVIVGAVAFAGLGANRPGFGGQPTEEPTPVPLMRGESSVEAGTYTAELQGNRYTVTVPDTDFGAVFVGWGATVSNDSWGIAWDGTGTVPNFSSMWIYSDVSTLYADACLWQGSEFTPGPTVDDLASALAALDDFTSSDVTGVSVAGYGGKRLQMSMPSGLFLEACQEAMYQSFEGKGNAYGSGGQTDDIRILDIDGVRHLLVTHYQIGTPEEAVAALNTMLETIRIEPI